MTVDTSPEDHLDDTPSGRRWFQPPSALQAVAMVVVLVIFGGVVGWVFTSNASQPDPNEADIGFLHDMAIHHDQAVALSWRVISESENPAVRDFAREVLFFQARELGIMQHLLEQYGEDPSFRPETAMDWMDMSVPMAAMPGLASPSEMDELASATGDDLDRLFLELMIEHHLGGIHMAEWAAVNAAESEVAELAALMEQNQSREVGEFRALQSSLGFPVSNEPIELPE